MRNYLYRINLIFDLFCDGGWEVTFYLMIFILAFIVLKNERVRSYILYPALLELVVILNPLSIRIFVDTGMLAESRYVRLFWLLQIAVIIAAVVSEGIRKLHTDSLKVTLFLLISSLMIIMGNYTFTQDNYQRMQNMYKLPDEAISIVESIKVDVFNDEKELSQIRIAVPMSLTAYIRQYDGNIKLLYGRIGINNEMASKVKELLMEEELDIQQIALYAREGICNYIVFEEDKIITEAPEDYGYELIDSVDGYVIYKDNMLH